MVRIDRRALLAAAPALAFSGAAEAARGRSAGAFTHGVASGDPTSTAIILWTRFVPSGAGAPRIGWEIADDEAFARVRARGVATTSALQDWCVKVDARGLAPGRPYFYRFLAAGGSSPTGMTRTAPARGGEALSLGVFSCSNKPFGYFHAYAHAAARSDIDVAIHTGDYIYEYQRGVYPNPGEIVEGREIEPATEIITASDYHARYASYRTDTALQELHRTKPMIAVWDDHELANDTWKDGAQNHQANEGDWAVRRLVAAKAYDDWLPIRTQRSPLQIYRRFDWGDLATILMLDTRSIGRDKQLDWRTALGPVVDGGPAAQAAAVRALGDGPLADPARTIMGAPQEAWMTRELERSKGRGAVWQVLGQQLVMGKQRFSQANMAMLGANASAGTKQWAGAGALIGELGYGWNLDAWSGYPKARERFLAACAAHANNALVLSGDSHNAWANNLGGVAGKPVAVEIAGAGVTSPGFERTFTNAPAGGREAAMRAANEELAWCDLTRRGYAVAKLTRARVETEWISFDSVASPTAGTPGIARTVAEASARGVGPWQVG
jgi:alkaline phosphatase D